MYTYKDRELTKEQVDKLAAEKGVEVDVFLTNNPDIQIQEAVVETTEPEGKTSTTETDTTVDATKVSDTESLSADGSLAYTDIEPYEDFYKKGTEFTKEGGAELRQTAGGTLEPLQLEEVIVTGEDKTKQKQARDSQIAISELSKASKIPETAITMGAGIAATTVDIAKGFLELTDKYGVAPMNYAIGRALGYDTTLRKEADASIENYAAIEDVTNLLREYTLRKYDSKGNEQDVYGLIEQGNYTDAAELAANQGFSAAPYLALSIASPVYGSALIGASVTGQEVVEGLKNRPEATLSEIYGASLAKGGVEFATNAIGGGIQRGILGIGKKLGTNKGAYKKAVDIYTKTYLGKVADVGFGLAKGGATNFVEEASASIGNAIVDKTVYGQEYSSLIRNAVNDGIVGLALGAPIGGAGGFKSIASKQQALEFLAPKKWTQDLAKQSMRLAEAQFNLDNAPTNKKEKFQKKTKKIESIIEMKKQQLYNSFDGLTKKEKIQYAENLDKIDSALGEIGNKRYTKGQQEDAQNDLKIATKQNEALVGTEMFDAKIEEDIAKVLKNRELIAEAEEKAKGIKRKDLKIVYLEEADGEQDAIFEKTVDGKTTIYVNKRVAEQTGQTNVLGHELLHYITNNAFETDNASVAPLVESFKEYLKETQPDIHRRVQERIDANYTNEDGSIKEGALEEYFNVFSDLVAKEKIVVDESFSDKIKNSTKKFLNGLGFSGVKLDTGKDVFDFIRNYQDNISNFKFKQLDIALESSKLKSKKDKQVVKESRSTVLEAINELVPSTVKTKEEFQSPKVFNNVFNSLINEGGAINNYIRSRSTSKQEAEKAIESVQDRMLNFDPAATRKDGGKVGVEGFGEFIFANTNFGKMDAKKALFKEGEKASQEMSLDAPEATTQLADEVSIDETKVKSTTSKLRRVLGIKQDDAIYDLAKEVSGEILSGDLPGKKVKTAINKEARKSKLRKAVSNLMGTEKAIDEQFLNKNILEILKALPASDLVKLEREAKVKVLAEQGPRLNVKDAREAVNKGLLPKDTNLQSGPKVSSKLPTTLEQAKEFFTQKRKAGLVNVVTEMLVKDAAPEVTKDKMEPAKRAKVLSEIDRAPALKFSKKEIEKANESVFQGFFEITEDDFAANDRDWSKILKELNVNNINLNDEVQRKKFLEDVKTSGLTAKLPKVFWRSFQGVTKKGDNGKRDYDRHVFFLNVSEADAWIAQTEKEGYKFANETQEFKDLFSKTAYTRTINKKTVSNLNAETFNDPTFIRIQDNKIKALKKIFLTFEDFIKEGKNKDNASLVAALLKSTSSWQGHFIRMSSPVKFYSLGQLFDPNTNKKLFTEEHTLPASGVAKYLFVQSVSGTVNDNFNNIERNYFQGALLNADDNKLAGIGVDGKKFSYKSKTPEGWTLQDNIWARYFNPNVSGVNFGIDPNSLMTYQGKTVYDVYGVDSAGNFIDQAFNETISKPAKKNNNKLPDTLKLSKSDLFNNNVLNVMQETDNNSQTEELKFSKSLDLNKDFNDIIENKTGIASDKTYARVKAEVAGANKGKFNFFIPPSAEDFVGLLYSTLGKGSTGDAQMAWYKAHLLNPFARAMENLANDRANMMQDFRGLKKALKIVPKNLRKKIKDTNFTQEQAVRAYIWDKQGMEIPGLSNKDQKDLVNFVNADANLTTFANQLIAINKGDEYAAPDAGWVAGTIGTDFIKALNTTKRSKYLEVWQQNVDQIFSEANLNKLEAAYGANYKEAMVDMLKRMETGRNTSSGSDRLAGRFTDWLTNSVGAIMFFNTRSAVLQTISAVNFINFSDNNVLKAGQAFANQPQYWKDFKKLFNSPFLLDRRSGLKLNVNEADIADMAKGPGNSARNVIAGILKAGFLPTQIADSFAIASGGASFYRNRIKALQKEGLTEAEAEEVAFRDFREIAEESQQSSRPDKISQQQAGPLGRVVLAFANTPAQYARLIKKAASDLKNGRGDAKTNISKIIYYGVAQNILFSALQQALFAISFGDEDEEEEKRNEKYFNIANGMSDSILRGIGVGGAIASVVKNTAIKLVKEEKKKSPKYQDVLVKEVLQISPPISSKVGKLRSAGRSVSWNKKEMMTKGWSIDNPAYLASANVISAITNVPADRAIKKITNIVDASNEETEYYKRIALALGWSSWELGIENKKDIKPESSTGKSRTRKRSRKRKKRN